MFWLSALPWLLAAAADLDGAIALYRQRNFAAAEAELRRMLATKEDARARLLLARTLIEQHRVTDAVVELDTTLARSKDPEVMFQAGRIVRELAERRFAGLQAAAPKSAPLLELSGRQLEMKGRYEDALKEYKAAAALNPTRPGIHYWIGNALWRLRRLEEAKAELQRELSANPHHAMANLRLGQVLIAMNDEPAAVSPLEFAVKAMPESIDARKEMGKAYRKVGRDADARRQWEAVAKQRPGDDQVHFLLGSFYREIGETSLSQQEFAKHREILQRRRELSEKK